jgi:hypothetical protein
MVVRVFLLEQPEGFFRTELRHAGKILDTKPIQHFSSLEAAYAHTQRAFDFAGDRCSVDCRIAFGLRRGAAWVCHTHNVRRIGQTRPLLEGNLRKIFG